MSSHAHSKGRLLPGSCSARLKPRPFTPRSHQTTSRSKSCLLRNRSFACFMFLLASGMGFGAFGKQIIGPDFLVHRQRRSARRRGPWRGIVLCRDIPVFRGIGNPPNVSVGVERSADQKIVAVVPQRQTVRHPRRHASTAGQITHQDWGADPKRLRTAKPTSLRADNQNHAAVAERLRPIKTDHAHWNLHAKPRAASSRFGRLNFHHSDLQALHLAIVTESPRPSMMTKVTRC